jgi:hypothetical protein
MTKESMAGKWFASCSLHNTAYLIQLTADGTGALYSVYTARQAEYPVKMQRLSYLSIAEGTISYSCSLESLERPLTNITIKIEWCGFRVLGEAEGWNESFYVESLEDCTNALHKLLAAENGTPAQTP